MSRVLGWIAVALAGWLAWLAWNPPPAPPLSVVRIAIPQPGHEARRWRVVTHRFVWKKGADAMRARLLALGIEPIVISRREDVEVHAFDDPRLFADRNKASRIAEDWRKLGVEAAVIEVEDEAGNSAYRVALGRFYLDAYAREQARLLDGTGMPYRYERRTMRLRTWRFATPALTRAEAERIWKALVETGLGEPRLIPEREFRRLFAAKPAGPSSPAAR